MIEASLWNDPPPAISEAEACACARRWYGLDGVAQALSGERDGNFHLSANDGQAYLLKFAHPAEAESVMAFQNTALRHIAVADPDLPTPRLVATVFGADLGREQLADGSTRLIRLTTWLAGSPQNAAPRSRAQRRAMAHLLARLDRALATAPQDGAPEHLIWDLSHALTLKPLLTHMVDVEERKLVQTVLERFEGLVQPVLPGLRRQVIHNDFNPSNVLVDSADPTRVAGVIDFGDMVTAPLIHDVAIGAAYHVEAEGDYLQPLVDFVGGYHSVTPLLTPEVDILIDLILMRMAMTVIIASWRAALQPGNAEYILRHAARAWNGLERAASLSGGEAREAFRAVTDR